MIDAAGNLSSGGTCPAHGAYAGPWCPSCVLQLDTGAAVPLPPLRLPDTCAAGVGLVWHQTLNLRIAAPALAGELLEIASARGRAA